MYMGSEVFKEINKWSFLKNPWESINRTEIFWVICLPVNHFIAHRLQIPPFYTCSLVKARLPVIIFPLQWKQCQAFWAEGTGGTLKEDGVSLLGANGYTLDLQYEWYDTCSDPAYALNSDVWSLSDPAAPAQLDDHLPATLSLEQVCQASHMHWHPDSLCTTVSMSSASPRKLLRLRPASEPLCHPVGCSHTLSNTIWSLTWGRWPPFKISLPWVCSLCLCTLPIALLHL